MGWPTHITQVHAALTSTTVLDLCDEHSFIQLCYFPCMGYILEKQVFMCDIYLKSDSLSRL